MMNRFLSLSLAAAMAFNLAGCMDGKGVNKKLATESEAAYRPTLNAAWADMSKEQQDTYNWAVQNTTLEAIHAEIKDPTPRRVVTYITDKATGVWTKEIDQLEVELIKKKPVFEEQEATLKQVSDNLAKIKAEVTWVGIKDSFFKHRVATVVFTNASPYDISSASFKAWMFIDGEQKSDRLCKFTKYFRGGVKAGQKATDDVRVDFGNDCGSWSTLAAQNAKKVDYVVEMDAASVKDFNEKRILPVYEETRQQYLEAIKERKDLIEQAKAAKVTMGG